jgi:hypothetical protein
MSAPTRAIHEIELRLLDGETILAKRCGVIPDLFADESGRLYRLDEPNTHDLNGQPVFKYEGHTLMQKHAVADAWFPGWDVDEGASIGAADGDQTNCAASNLIIERTRQGRPRDNAIIRSFKAMTVFFYVRDLSIAAHETGYTAEDLLEVVARYSPNAILDREKLGLVIEDRYLTERIGMGQHMRKLVKLDQERRRRARARRW